MKPSRRQFLKTAVGAGTGLALAPARRASAARVGPNDTVRLAVVGCGGMGRAHIYSLAYQDGVELVALCDVYKKRYEEAAENVGTIYRDKRGMPNKKPAGYQDFRRVLERDDIDAVLFATPDHWHAIMTIMACQAGKDVYVEKPISTTVQEEIGRAHV